MNRSLVVAGMLVVALLLSPPTCRAADPEKPAGKKSPAADKPQKSVDDALRKSLDDELFKDLPPAPARPTKPALHPPHPTLRQRAFSAGPGSRHL